MSVTLMHIEYQATDITHSSTVFREIADWLDERLRNDEQLKPAERADPTSVNLLANLVMDDQPPTTADREAVQRFHAIVERNTRGDDSNTARAAREIAERLAGLATRYEPLHLALL